jgi:hypothetical protein
MSQDSVDAVDPLLEGRDETPLQRCDRNLVELLQEVRVVQTGVQVLFAFLLMAPLSARFPQLSSAQRIEYLVTLAAAGLAALVLTAPTAHHRILFRCGDKEHLVSVANRYTLVGLACVAVAMLGSLVFVASILLPAWLTITLVVAVAAGHAWCWFAAPLLRRRHVTRPAGGKEGAVVSLRKRAAR